MREQGELRALGAHCTHYGAPLVRGAYDGGGTVRCPCHGACFNTVTSAEDFPGESWTNSIIHREKTFNVLTSVSGLDSLGCHKVEERESQIIVSVTEDNGGLVTRRRHIRIREITEDSEERIVIVGGGAAGQSAAKTLRSVFVSQYPKFL